MARCLISFGANIGHSADTISQAVDQLRSRLSNGLKQFEMSRLFRTPAVGGPAGQPPFINAVAALEVERLSAWDMWRAVRDVEQALGRVRIERWEARRIDLDVLLFEDEIIWTQSFKLPHPRMVMRRFILEPALDVAAQWREPVSAMTIDELARRLRSGASSIALVADNLLQAQGLLERAAAVSRSIWQTPRVIAPAPTTNAVGPRGALASAAAFTVKPTVAPTDARWLGLVPAQALRSATSVQLEPSPKLVFVLAEAVQATDAAWEDVHRRLAAWLGLAGWDELAKQREGQHKQSACLWPLSGPRYLLSSDDLSWTEHEIVAAMEAMDCPVEVAS